MSLALAAASHEPFWSSTLALALVVGSCSLVVGVTVALVLFRRSARGSVRERVGEFVSPPIAPHDASTGAEPVTSPMLTRTERSLEGERWWG